MAPGEGDTLTRTSGKLRTRLEGQVAPADGPQVTTSTNRLARRGLLAVGVSLALAASALVSAAPSQAVYAVCPAGHRPAVHTVSPGVNLAIAISSLCPGDTLALRPGTYRTGYLRFYPNTPGQTGILRGTPTRRTTITAADPQHPPLVQGGLQFSGADYWRLSHLRVQATAPGLSALAMIGGAGWSVTSSEFFGARQTNSMANVLIAGSHGYPRGFEFRGNRIHDAAQSNRRDATDHNLYIMFQGAPGSGGVVTRNVLWNAPHGAGIKIGNGGAYNALGPWGVTVAMNTIYNSGRQILLHGNVRNNNIWGNLLQRATQRFVSDPRTTQIYIHDVTGKGNRFAHNYAFSGSMFAYDPRRAAAFGTGNRSYNAPAYNPLLRSSSVAVLVPANRLARPYGAAGTMRW